MAGNCCNKHCCLIAGSYIFACNNILGGIGSIWTLTIIGIIAGLIAIALGVLLLIGLIQNKKELILGFIIAEGLLIILALVGIFTGAELPGHRSVIIEVIVIIIHAALLAVVCLYYMEMRRSGGEAGGKNTDQL